MSAAEQLSSLIETIYDSAVSPALWPVALGGITRFVGGSATGLYAKDAASRTGAIHYRDEGLGEAQTARYFEHYIRIDPSTIRHYFAAVGDLVSTIDMLPYEEFRQTRFYVEWVEPAGLVDHLAAILEKDQTSFSMVGVFRSREQGLVDEPMRRRMRLVVPHVRRAVMIGGLLERRSIANDALTKALDAVRSATFLVDAAGAIVHANTAGLRMLAGDGPVRDIDGHLTGIEHDLRAALSPEEASPSFEPLLARDGQRYLVQTLPLRGPLRTTDNGRPAAAAVFIQPTSLSTPAVPEAIARAYQLTPTELRTLLAAVEIGGVSEIAEALGISETTVKFHLRSVYAKTGSHRQSDLVKLVAGFSGP